MNLRAVGLNFRTAAVDLREKLALAGPAADKAAADLSTRLGAEAVVLSTCNRVELYVARPAGDPPFDAAAAADFLAAAGGLAAPDVAPHLYAHADAAAVRHLCRVAASLDSLVVGEGQIAGQVRRAFDSARKLGATGPLLNALIPHALRAAKRVRTETGIAHGRVSVSSVAVDYVRQVFDRFDDKTVLIVGAGKMSRLTLKHLQALKPKHVIVTNRSPGKARELAEACGGAAMLWDHLSEAVAEADIVVSSTGAPDPIMSRERFEREVRPRRPTARTLVVLDIAVPRDFDPAIHDGDRVCVFNVDDLTRVRDDAVAARRRHVGPAEAIVDAEVARFVADWDRRRAGPLIGRLTAEGDKVRAEVVGRLLPKLNGKLTDADRQQIEYHFRLFQQKLLHGPMTALQQAGRDADGGTFVEAIRRLFRLGD